MALTDAECRAAQPAAKLQKLTDGGGLQLWVQPSGARLWRLAYRFGGKQKLLALGVYPTISLARARQAREDAKRLLANGADPTSEKKRRKQEHSNAVTFRAIADEYLTKLKREGRAAATIAKTSAPTAPATARKRHDRETRRSEVWRKELAAIMEAKLAQLDALTHGFTPRRSDV